MRPDRHSSKMIAKFNRTQIILDIVNMVAGLIALTLASAFFYIASRFVLTSFGVDKWKPISLAISAGGLLLVFVSGLRLHQKGGGTYGYQDSDLMPNWEAVSGGSFAMDYYKNRITAPAHALTQIFLCAPLQILNCIGRLRSLLPNNQALELRLTSLLDQIASVDRWQTVGDYPEQPRELGYLIHMNQIQFSPKTGKIRSKK